MKKGNKYEFKLTGKKRPIVYGVSVIEKEMEKHTDKIDNVLQEVEFDTFLGKSTMEVILCKVSLKDISRMNDEDDDNPIKTFNAQPFVQAQLGYGTIAIKIGEKRWMPCFTTTIELKGKKYFNFDNGRKHESTLGMLSYLLASKRTEVVPSIRAILYDGIEKLMGTNAGSVELAGMDAVIQRCVETIEINDPRLINRHLLLAGPPGCGKSEIVKEIINKTPDWLHYPLNVGEISDWSEFMKNLDKLMNFLGKKAMIIADEIDEIGLTREKDSRLVYDLLRTMDGVSELGKIKFVATTNRPESLDPALLRIGRFGPIVLIDKPDKDTFEKIVEFYNERYNASVDAKKVASSCKDAVGCDIRAAFEDCIIHCESISTKNVIKNITYIIKSKNIETSERF